MSCKAYHQSASGQQKPILLSNIPNWFSHIENL